MNSSFLKTARASVALLFFIPILLFFCDFADVMPDQLSHLLKIQVVPAMLAGSIGIIAFLFLLTILFGRIYCSVICPLGVMQDIINRFSRRGQKKNKKKRWFQYAKPKNYLRYGILGICAILFAFGIITPLLLLDPYSNFGRIATNLFRPLVMWGNNLINWGAVKAGNFNFYHVSVYTITTLSLIIAGIALLTTGILSFFRGRLFCNTICPVGSLLGLLSRFSMFRIRMDESRCNHCGACAKACKSECIDSQQIRIDTSRCVTCYNCLSRCKQQAIGYEFGWKKKIQKRIEIDSTIQADLSVKSGTGFSRRTFLTTGTALVATLPVIPAWADSRPKDSTKLTPITPPGSLSLDHFKEKCTACHLCVTHCPQQILHPAGFTFGLGYAFKPHMVYKNAYCNFECTICSQVCPNNAIVHNLTIEKKKTTQVGIAQFEKNLCIVHTEGTDCGACSEHCPTQAVKMMPYKDGLRLPEVTADLCVGCGGCEYICPVRPVRAINVLANETHQSSRKPEEEEIKHFEVDDFGF